MNTFKPAYLIIAASLALSACDSDKDPVADSPASTQASNETNSQPETQATQQDLELLYDQAKRTLFQARPLTASVYGMSPDEIGIYYADKLDDYSPETEAALRQQLSALSQQISLQSSAGLDQSAQQNQKVMANLTRYFAGHEKFNIGYIDTWMGLSPFVVNQINGPLIDIPRGIQENHKIDDLKDAQEYVKRLNEFGNMVDNLMLKLEADVAQGWIPPKVILKGASRYYKNFTSAKPEAHPMVQNLQDKLGKLESVSDEQKKQLLADAAKAVSEVVYPAYKKVDERANSLIDKASEESGIWAQPGGAEYYADAALQLGDSKLTADQIHQVGLDEVARISDEMDAILKAQGYKDGSVGERMIKLGEEKRFLYPDSAEGRKQLLSDLNGYIDEITEKMAPYFTDKPKYKVEVRSFPVEIQDGAPGGQYTSPSLDGSKPGIYWINLRDPKANPKFSLKTLTYHEANPGHHWQVALNLEQDDLPFLRRMAPYNAYVEGWALYSERVAKEIGMYETDPFSDLGRLQAELYRAVRLVVDTGLHHKRWTREQAIEYFARVTGVAKSDVVAEIERYMAWPGQALGYKLGMLKILDLRAKAKTELGDKFDLAEFHSLVLMGGAVPMSVLEEKVDSWITLKK